MRVLKPLVFSIAFAVVASSARAAAPPDPTLDAPPSGLVPATVKVSEILAKHDAAGGKTAATIVEDWSFTDTGIAGTEHLVQSGTDYHSTIVKPAGSDEYGQSGGKRWHRDKSGFTTATTATDEQSFQAMRVNEDASDPKSDVSLAGETTGASPAYVLKVTADGARHPEWISYDASTYRIVRIDKVVSKHRLVTTFDDFRTTGGVTQPWHVHDAYWTSELDDDWHLTAFHAGGAIKPREFAAPVNPVVAGVSARATLPSQFAEGSPILRVTVNGRGLDFELDPSQRSSYIDIGVARELNLPTFGANTRVAGGGDLSYDTVLADATIGPLALHDFKLRATDVAYKPSAGTEIVGTLGYDFLAANVIHIDYVHGLVEAIPTAQMAPAPAKPIAGALDVPMQFDDGMLLVPMAIGDGFTERVALDTSMPWTMVLGDYMKAHGASFQDVGSHHQESVPFADSASYGQDIDVWISQTKTLAFANLNFVDLPVIATNFPFGDRDIDAFLGYDYLGLYDLYLDYPHDRLLLVPNEWFYKIAKKDKPGA